MNQRGGQRCSTQPERTSHIFKSKDAGMEALYNRFLDTQRRGIQKSKRLQLGKCNASANDITHGMCTHNFKIVIECEFIAGIPRR